MQPTKLGRYEILKELGRGAMGRVLLAHDPQIDRRVAIKIIQGFEPESEEARRRFLGEARSAGKLLHPGIVTLFDAGEVDGTLYLAMELVEGETLDRYCRPGNLLPVPTVLESIAVAAEALHYAHGMGIIHRDIKPGNLMRTQDGSIKIMDFGLARGTEAGSSQEGALLGSPAYMSPEQIRGRPVDGRSDLFSLGIVLHELLTAEKPFTGDSISSIIYRIVHEDPSPPRSASDRLTPPLERLLAGLLAKQPEDRPESGAELARRLREAAGASAAATAPAEPAEASNSADHEIPAVDPRPPRRSSPVPFIVGLVTLLGLLGAAGWYVGEQQGWFDREPPPPVIYEATVRAQPAEATVQLDGEPLDPANAGLVRFEATEPYGLLTAEYRCRREEYRLGLADAGAEIALVLEPVELSYTLEGAAAATSVELNGESLGATPVDLNLDLCAGNTLALRADGFRPVDLEIPEDATPLEARTLLGAIEWSEIPRGTLVLAASAIRLVRYVDGRRLEASETELELPEGPHQIRVKNDAYWIDVTESVEVVAGETKTAEIRLPPLEQLVVLAYPPNCTVDIRRPGGKWKYLDDVPLRRKIAAGTYEVRVTLKPTGETRTRKIDLGTGGSPEIRVSFGSPS